MLVPCAYSEPDNMFFFRYSLGPASQFYDDDDDDDIYIYIYIYICIFISCNFDINKQIHIFIYLCIYVHLFI